MNGEWKSVWKRIGFTPHEVNLLIREEIEPSSPIGEEFARARMAKINTYLKSYNDDTGKRFTREEAIERAESARLAAAKRHHHDSDYIWAELYAIDPDTRSKYAKRQAAYNKAREKSKG